jgi:hypothetical protein
LLFTVFWIPEVFDRPGQMEEIAARLRRDRSEVRDKIAEMGRACR